MKVGCNVIEASRTRASFEVNTLFLFINNLQKALDPGTHRNEALSGVRRHEILVVATAGFSSSFVGWLYHINMHTRAFQKLHTPNRTDGLTKLQELRKAAVDASKKQKRIVRGAAVCVLRQFLGS